MNYVEIPLRATQRIIFFPNVLQAGNSMKSGSLKRSIKIGDRSTSISVEDVFWNALREIAAAQGISIADLILRIDGERQHGNLSSAVRVFVLGCAGDFWKKTATMTFDECADRLAKLARSKAAPPDALAKMTHELDAYLASFPDPNVRFYERCKVRIAFANKARSDEVAIQFLRKLDE